MDAKKQKIKKLPTEEKRPGRFYTKNNGIVKTKQEFGPECDINNILNTYRKSGTVTHLNGMQPQYGFATGNDFRESLEIVRKANENFQTIPSDIRAQFNNNPEQFLDFASDPTNEAQMAEWGLIDAPPTNVQEIPKQSITEPSKAPQAGNPPNTSEYAQETPPNGEHSPT